MKNSFLKFINEKQIFFVKFKHQHRILLKIIIIIELKNKKDKTL